MTQYFSLDAPGLPSALISSLVEEAERAGAGRLSLVGGVARDLMLYQMLRDSWRPLSDLDLLLEGSSSDFVSHLQDQYGPDRVSELQLHEQFGTAELVIDGLRLDVACARTETYPAPGENPHVQVGTLEQDLARRDFTVNAMALRLCPSARGQLMDLHGGEADLKSKHLRLLHEDSFIDDPTRAWRACRYEVRYGFQWDAGMVAAWGAARKGEAPTRVSLQRYGNEWAKVLTENDIVAVVHALLEHDVFAVLHAELTLTSPIVTSLQQVLSSGTGPCFGRLEGLEEALWLALAMALPAEDRHTTRDFASGKQGRAVRWDQGPDRVSLAYRRLRATGAKGDWGATLKQEAAPELLVLHSLGPVCREAVQWWLDEGRMCRTVVSAAGLMERGLDSGPLLGQALEAAQWCAWEGGTEASQWDAALHAAGI